METLIPNKIWHYFLVPGISLKVTLLCFLSINLLISFDELPSLVRLLYGIQAFKCCQAPSTLFPTSE